jgi:HK97 family phage prohead protease
MEKFTTEAGNKLRSIFDGAEFKSLVESTQKSTDSDTGTFEVIITTENLDRYQEVISIDGWELDHYLNNPVVLWGHDHSKLIGVCTTLAKRDGKLVAKGKFAPTEEGQEKRKLYEQGFLKATSVGFIEKEREGNLITKAELLEFSFVSVPANPYALSLAIKTERSIDELVTKGIFTIKEVEVEKTDTEPIEEETPETPETPAENPELTDDQKALADLITKQVLAGLKDSSALEDTTSDPERTDDEPVEDVEEDPAVKDFENRKKLQQIDTILGEVLADIRSKNTHRS